MGVEGGVLSDSVHVASAKSHRSDDVAMDLGLDDTNEAPPECQRLEYPFSGRRDPLSAEVDQELSQLSQGRGPAVAQTSHALVIPLGSLCCLG